MASILAVACVAHRVALPHVARRVVAPRAFVTLAAKAGDVATIKYSLRPDMESRVSTYGQNAELLVGSLPFDVGEVSFVVNGIFGRGGGYLDGIHATVAQMEPGEKKTDVSIDSGAGEYNEGGVITVPIEQAPQGLKAGMAVMLSGAQGQQIQATCTEMNDETLTLDSNHPLAGCRFLLDVELMALDPASKFATATVAGGCFWGLELAYQREPGVVGTAVGYTQGELDEPSYEAVCSGTTGHTEAVQIVYDPKVVSYERLCKLLVERLDDNVYLLNQVGNDRGTQYRHGIYPSTDEEEQTARAVLAALGEHKSLGHPKTEVVQAAKFWPAEDYHMQYLQKGGQNAKKQAEETIRCYG